MLFAKINPPASVVQQTSPFTHDVAIGEWMSASANPYVLGSEMTTFSVYFGNFNPVAPEGQPAQPLFGLVYTTMMSFTSEQLSDWGTDDSVMLEIIAASLNTEITEFLSVPEIANL
jgi:hypothetical protein